VLLTSRPGALDQPSCSVCLGLLCRSLARLSFDHEDGLAVEWRFLFASKTSPVLNRQDLNCFHPLFVFRPERVDRHEKGCRIPAVAIETLPHGPGEMLRYAQHDKPWHTTSKFVAWSALTPGSHTHSWSRGLQATRYPRPGTRLPRNFLQPTSAQQPLAFLVGTNSLDFLIRCVEWCRLSIDVPKKDSWFLMHRWTNAWGERDRARTSGRIVSPKVGGQGKLADIESRRSQL